MNIYYSSVILIWILNYFGHCHYKMCICLCKKEICRQNNRERKKMKYLASQPTIHLILSILLPKHIERCIQLGATTKFSRFFIASAPETLYIVTSICITYLHESFTCDLFSYVYLKPLLCLFNYYKHPYVTYSFCYIIFFYMCIRNTPLSKEFYLF